MLKLFIIRDEAMREVHKGLNETLRHAFEVNQRESRSFEIGQGLGIQSASDVVEGAIENARVLVALSTHAPENVRFLQRAMNLTEHLAARLPYLQKGEAIISVRGLASVYPAHVPFQPGIGYASQKELAARQALEFAILQREIIRTPPHADDSQSLSYLELLGEVPPPGPSAPEIPETEFRNKFFADHYALLIQVKQHPECFTTQHYRTLKWGAGRGTRIKTDLVKWGLVLCDRKSQAGYSAGGGRPPEVMTLTPKGGLFLHEYETK